MDAGFLHIFPLQNPLIRTFPDSKQKCTKFASRCVCWDVKPALGKKKLSPLWRRKLDDVPLSNIFTKRGSKLTAVIYTSLYYFSLMYYRIISNIICNVIVLHIFFCLLYTKMSWKQSHNLFVYSLVYLLSLCGKDHESSQKGTVPFSWLTSVIITAITAELSQIHWVIFGPHNISGDSLQNRDAAFP